MKEACLPRRVRSALACLQADLGLQPDAMYATRSSLVSLAVSLEAADARTTMRAARLPAGASLALWGLHGSQSGSCMLAVTAQEPLHPQFQLYLTGGGEWLPD